MKLRIIWFILLGLTSTAFAMEDENDENLQLALALSLSEEQDKEEQNKKIDPTDNDLELAKALSLSAEQHKSEDVNRWKLQLQQDRELEQAIKASQEDEKHKTKLTSSTPMAALNHKSSNNNNDNNRPSLNELRELRLKRFSSASNSNNNNSAVSAKGQKQLLNPSDRPTSLKALALIASLELSDEQAAAKLPQEMIAQRNLLKKAIAFNWRDLLMMKACMPFLLEEKELIPKMEAAARDIKRMHSQGLEDDEFDAFIERLYGSVNATLTANVKGNISLKKKDRHVIMRLMWVLLKGTREEKEQLKKYVLEIQLLAQQLIDNEPVVEAFLKTLSNGPKLEVVADTLFCCVIQQGDSKRCKKLLSLITNKSLFQVAIGHALVAGKKDIVSALLNHVYIEIDDEDIIVIISAAFLTAVKQYGQGKDIKEILDCCSMLIRDYGFNINKWSLLIPIDPEGHEIKACSPFAFALVALRRHSEKMAMLIKWFINHGADINAKSEILHNSSPLVFAIQMGSFPLVKLLLDNGAHFDESTLEIARGEIDEDDDEYEVAQGIIDEIQRRLNDRR